MVERCVSAYRFVVKRPVTALRATVTLFAIIDYSIDYGLSGFLRVALSSGIAAAHIHFKEEPVTFFLRPREEVDNSFAFEGSGSSN